jgi:hypothetical protein
MEQKMRGRSAMKGQYGRLLAMAGLSFMAMFGLMYAMVDSFGNVFANLNQFYMVGLMVAPMVVIELALMRSMYPNRRINGLIMAVSLLAMILCWVFIRQQTAISEQQFLRSMIPHHGGAVLMCEQTQLQDPQLRKLCAGIVSSQQAEIAFMKSKLK